MTIMHGESWSLIMSLDMPIPQIHYGKKARTMDMTGLRISSVMALTIHLLNTAMIVKKATTDLPITKPCWNQRMILLMSDGEEIGVCLQLKSLKNW